MGAELQQLLDTMTGTSCWSAVTEVHYGQDVVQIASGLADVSNSAPARPGMCFRAGSIAKSFAAAIVLQLSREQGLSLDDPFQRWLIVPGIDSRVTTRQLLNHTSGIFNYTEGMPLTPADLGGVAILQAYSRSDLLGVAVARAPYFAPGSAWHYSNTNYLLTAMLIEELTGQAYEDAVRDRILRPLDLRGTYLPGTSPFLPAPHLRSYARAGVGAKDLLIDVTVQNPSRAWASGDIVSTTSDVLRFHRSLIEGTIIGPEQRDELMTTVPGGDGRQYGLGVFTYRTSTGIKVWGSSGSFGGYLSFVIHSGAAGPAVAVTVVPRTGQALGDIREFCARAVSVGDVAPG